MPSKKTGLPRPRLSSRHRHRQQLAYKYLEGVPFRKSKDALLHASISNEMTSVNGSSAFKSNDTSFNSSSSINSNDMSFNSSSSDNSSSEKWINSRLSASNNSDDSSANNSNRKIKQTISKRDLRGKSELFGSASDELRNYETYDISHHKVFNINVPMGNKLSNEHERWWERVQNYTDTNYVQGVFENLSEIRRIGSVKNIADNYQLASVENLADINRMGSAVTSYKFSPADIYTNPSDNISSVSSRQIVRRSIGQSAPGTSALGTSAPVSSESKDIHPGESLTT